MSTPNTIQTVILALLEDTGLFDDEAVTILEAFKPTEEASDMTGRWDLTVESFGAAAHGLIAVVWGMLAAFAATWLKTHTPQHPARIALALAPDRATITAEVRQAQQAILARHRASPPTT